MEELDLQILHDGLVSRLNTYRCNHQLSEHIQNYSSDNQNNISSLNNQLNDIVTAKNEWETCIDSLEHQAVVVLDNNLNVIRTNKTIELWGWADVNTVNGTHILDLIKPAIDCEFSNNWLEEWCQLEVKTNVKWELESDPLGKRFRFSFYPIRDLDSLYCDDDNCFAVLSISDVTDGNVVKFNQGSKSISSRSDLVKIAEHRANKLAEQLINSQEYERKRISCELHDGLAPILTALKFQVGTVVKELNETSQQRKNDTVLKDVLDNVKVALSDLKRISVDLQSPIIDDRGLLMALDWFVNKYKKVYTDLEVCMQLDVCESDISDDKKNVIYRIVQEAMSNIAKHAHANKIFLQLTLSCRGLLLRISDNGCGFNIADKKCNAKAGLGLKNMEERAVNSDAEFVMISDSLSGTNIQVFWVNN